MSDYQYAVELPRSTGPYVRVSDLTGRNWGTREQADAIVAEVQRRGYRCRLIRHRISPTLVEFVEECPEGSTYEGNGGHLD